MEQLTSFREFEHVEQRESSGSTTVRRFIRISFLAVALAAALAAGFRLGRSESDFSDWVPNRLATILGVVAFRRKAQLQLSRA